MTTLSEIKKLFIDMKENPRNYVDLDNVEDESENYVTFRRKSLADVAGITRLGKGHYSTVYDIGEGKALKIVHNEEGDEGYEKFIEFLRLHGRHYSSFPKLYYSGVWKHGSEVTKVYVIEKLDELNDGNFADRSFVAEYLNDYFRNWNKRYSSRFIKFDPEFTSAIDALKDFYTSSTSSGCSIGLDFHPGNLTFRNNGDPVILDPFC